MSLSYMFAVEMGRMPSGMPISPGRPCFLNFPRKLGHGHRGGPLLVSLKTEWKNARSVSRQCTNEKTVKVEVDGQSKKSVVPASGGIFELFKSFREHPDLYLEPLEEAIEAFEKVNPEVVEVLASLGMLFTKQILGSYKTDPMNVNFDDLQGLQQPKSQFRKVSDIFKAGWEDQKILLELPNGILLYGPPRTGKTTLVHALARETGVSFFSVSAHEISAVEIGKGVSMIKSLFFEARDGAPSIVYIPSIDSIAEIENAHLTLFELVDQMEICINEERPVLVIADNNSTKLLDPTLKSFGNFSVEVHVAEPDEDARRKLVGLYLQKKTREEDREEFCNLIASRTQGFVAPQLATIAMKSIWHALNTRGDDHVILEDICAALGATTIESIPLQSER